MKIAVAQINTSVGNFQKNKENIIANIVEAHSNDADLIVFPECTTTGYPQKDLLYNSDFIDQNIKLVHEICKFVEDEARNIMVVIGFVNKNSLTGELYNSAAVIENGTIIGTYDKHLLPNYKFFDERRYFTPGTRYPSFKKNGIEFGITICEDIWDDGYQDKPITELCNINAGIKFFINLSSSPFSSLKEAYRATTLRRRVEDSEGRPILYVNQVGAQDGLIFDGYSLFINADGYYVIIGDAFKESLTYVNFNEFTKEFKSCGVYFSHPQFPKHDELPKVFKAEGVPSYLKTNEMFKIYKALVLGIRDYFEKTGFEKAYIGLSGGIDSAVVCALACSALQPKNVVGLLMPSRYSSKHSVTDALLLAKNLGVKTHTIKIDEMHQAYNKTLKGINGEYKSDVTEQNLQARIRGNLLMAFSNDDKKAMVLSTGNKSEMSVGYCTQYGDMCGGLAVIADVYKTKVYSLAGYMNFLAGYFMIPKNTVEKPPSAELKPGQKDTDSLPPYEVLDSILMRYIEKQESYDEIIKGNFDPAVVKKILMMVDNNEFKRQQAPPGLIISERDLTTGRRMPIANGFKV